MVGLCFFLKTPGGEGFSRTGGAEGSGGSLRRIGEFFFGGGGVNMFFGAEMATKTGSAACQI